MIESGTRPRLELVECGRGLAAFAVVLFHANAVSQSYGWHSFEAFTVFQYGVDFFFVLSGFIIYFAHAQDFGKARRLGVYAKKRAIRLLPTLWIITTLTFGLQSVLGMPVDFHQYVRSALPYPSLLATDPAVVWTLRHEFIFYAAIAVVIASRRVGMAILAIWALATIAQLIALSFGAGLRGSGSLVLASYSLDFFFGMAIAALHARKTFSPSLWPLLIGVVLLIAACAWDLSSLDRRLGASDYLSPGAAWFAVGLGLIFALIVHGIVRVENHISAPRSLVLLGGATYSLYLIHAPVNGLAMLVLEPLSFDLSGGLGAVILVALGTAAGIVFHRFVEDPTGRWLRKRFLKSPETQPVSFSQAKSPTPFETLR